MSAATSELEVDLTEAVSRTHVLTGKIIRARAASSDASGADIDADAEIDNARAAVLAVNDASALSQDLLMAVDAMHETAGDVAGYLAAALATAADRARAIVSHLTRACHLVNSYGSEVFSELDRARLLSDDLAADLVGAVKLAADLDDIPDRIRRHSAAEEATRRVARVAPSAGRLVMAAAAMLPEGDRACYAEEFRYELRDLAAAGAGRAGQLVYAARQLRSAWGLRAALGTPARRRAVP